MILFLRLRDWSHEVYENRKKCDKNESEPQSISLITNWMFGKRLRPINVFGEPVLLFVNELS